MITMMNTSFYAFVSYCRSTDLEENIFVSFIKHVVDDAFASVNALLEQHCLARFSLLTDDAFLVLKKKLLIVTKEFER